MTSDRVISMMAVLGLMITIPDPVWRFPAIFLVIFMMFNASAGVEEFFKNKVQKLSIEKEKPPQ